MDNPFEHLIIDSVGPCTVVRQLSEQNYLTEIPDRRKRSQLCHISFMKPYDVCASSQAMSGSSDSTSSEVCPVLTACTVVHSAFSRGGRCGDSLRCGRLKISELLSGCFVGSFDSWKA